MSIRRGNVVRVNGESPNRSSISDRRTRNPRPLDNIGIINSLTGIRIIIGSDILQKCLGHIILSPLDIGEQDICPSALFEFCKTWSPLWSLFKGEEVDVDPCVHAALALEIGLTGGNQDCKLLGMLCLPQLLQTSWWGRTYLPNCRWLGVAWLRAKDQDPSIMLTLLSPMTVTPVIQNQDAA
eukprot:scaffold14761_cov142-Skeletonema_menzelii.AAC.3